MASAFTHAIAAAALGTCLVRGEGRRRVWALGALCAVAPDADVIAFALGIPYQDMLGHRGLTHSLAFAVALGLTAAAVVLARTQRRTRRPAQPADAWRVRIYLVLAAASHGVLDAMTSGGLGVAFLAPLSAERWFFPWRPIKVSPLSVGRFLGARGLAVLASEALWIWLPSAALAAAAYGLARRRARTARATASTAASTSL